MAGLVCSWATLHHERKEKDRVGGSAGFGRRRKQQQPHDRTKTNDDRPTRQKKKQKGQAE